MWGGYNNPWSGTGSPNGAIGTGCAQIRASTTGFNPIEFHNSNPGGTGGDTTRHRGIMVRWLYVVGDNYTGTGLYAHNFDDNVMIIDNVFQRLAVGIDVYLDSPVIEKNSIQDDAGNAINVAGVLALVRDNLLFDIGGTGVANSGINTTIIGNRIGDTSLGGVASTGRSASVTGNAFVDVVGSCGICFFSAPYSVASANTIDYTALNYGFGSKMPITNDAIYADPSSTGVSITGNSIATIPIQGGYAIDTVVSSNDAVSGNVVSGYWNGGVGSLGLSGSANAANAFPAFTLNPPATASSVTIAARYLASSMSAVGNGNPITTWTDSSGIGRDLAIAHGTGPLYEATSLVHSGPGIRFDGTSQALWNSTMMFSAASQPKTAFIVLALSSTASGRGSNISVINSVSTTAAGYFNSSGNTVCTFVAGVVCGSQTAGATSTTYVVEWVFNGSSSRIAVNGASSALTEALPNPQWFTGLIIGANGALNSEWFPGDMAEIDVYNGAATTTDAATIGAALCSTYGVTCGGSW
jgi:hypothetical protein